EPSQVHAEDRRLAVTHLAHRTEDGPVAAKDQRQVRGRQLAEILFLAQIGGDDLAMLAKEGQAALDLLGDAGTLIVSQQEDFHGASAPITQRLAPAASKPRSMTGGKHEETPI